MKIAREFNKSITELYNPDPKRPKNKKGNKGVEVKTLRNRDDISELEVGGNAALIDAFLVLMKHFEKDK